VLIDESGRLVREFGRVIGKTTNNIADSERSWSCPDLVFVTGAGEMPLASGCTNAKSEMRAAYAAGNPFAAILVVFRTTFAFRTATR
jgi:hypothetical protein